MCYDPYISISQTDVEEEIKNVLGLDAMLGVGESGGYVTVLEALRETGVATYEDFRHAALDGIWKMLMEEAAYFKRKVAEYVEEQAKLEANTCALCDCDRYASHAEQVDAEA